MRPGLMIGARHVVRYTVPAHQTVPDLLPALAEFRRGQPAFATGFMVGLMEAPCMAAVYPPLEAGEVAAAGEHGLRVVDAARFRDRLAAKQAQLPRPGPSPLPGDTHGPHHRP